MKFSASVLLTIFATSALALPERAPKRPPPPPACVANQPNCAVSKYIGDDYCRCSGQKAPCGNWKCGWDGAHSIVCAQRRLTLMIPPPYLCHTPIGSFYTLAHNFSVTNANSIFPLMQLNCGSQGSGCA